MQVRKNDFLNIPERQSVIAILLIFWRLITSIVKTLWPFLLLLLIRGGSNDQDFWYTSISLGVAAVATILPIIAYFKFYYYIEEDAFIIEQGIFNKRKLSVTFDRIQNVNFEQSVIHRIFNVVRLVIDTAGAKGTEFTISALSKEKADQIRDYLIEQREIATPVNLEDDIQDISTINTIQESLLHLDISDLIKIGLGQNHFRSIGIIIGTVFGFYTQIEQIIGEEELQEQGGAALESFDPTFYVLISLGVVILFIALVISIVSTVMRYYDLRFLKTSAGYKIITGLFTRREYAANHTKIQFIQWSTNPLKKLFNLYSLQLPQAAGADLLYIPGCYLPHIDTVCKAYYEDNDPIFESHGIHWREVIRLFFAYSIIPLGLYTGIYFLRYEILPPMFHLVIWSVLALISSIIYYRKWEYAISLDGIRIKKGLFATHFFLLKWYKIQSIQLRKSIFQNRRGYTDIIFYTASGALRIPYIKEEKALALQNYGLYKIESSLEDWM